MKRSSTQEGGWFSRIGIVPTLLGASLVAVIAAVSIVQGLTVNAAVQSGEHAVQVSLEVDLDVLHAALMRRGTDWRVDAGGRLTVDGKPAEGLDAVVEEVGRLTRAAVTVFAGDLRVATTVRAADGTRATGTRLAPGPAHDAVFSARTVYRGAVVVLGERYFAAYQPLLDRDGQVVGAASVAVPAANVQAMPARVVWQTSLTALAVVLLTGVALWAITRAALRPLSTLAGAVNRIGDGDLGVTVPCATRRDQLGEIGRAVETLRVKALHAQAVEQQAASAREMAVRRQTGLENLTQEFGASVAGVLTELTSSGEQMHHAATEMAETAGRSASGLISKAQEIEQSSQNLSKVAAAAEQLSASVSEVSSHVGQVADAARDAVARAAATDATVRVLGTAANEIGAIVSLIDSIASQTNLLALNATIEAARAGDAGKGFAVVAGEVKALAAQTATATRQIGQQIGAIQAATERAERSVTEVTAAIGQVSDVAASIAGAVEQQGLATREIASQVTSVAHTTEAAMQAMLAVSRAAQDTGTNAQRVLTAVNGVVQQSGMLRDEVLTFTATMRATDKTDRRAYERVPGGGLMAELQADGHGTVSVPILTLSLGGASLACPWPCRPGTAVSLRLAGGATEVWSRVVAVRDDGLAVAFRQDRATLAEAGRVMELIAERARGRAAA